jgi:hypothetical protein
MHATPGSRQHAVAVLLTVALLGLSACGGSDGGDGDTGEPSRETSPPATTEPTVDQAADDEAAIEQLATELWAVRQQAYNSGEATAATFEGIYSPSAIETELARIAQYRADKILRTGAPEITAIEATATGDTGEILLCLDETGWDAVEDGEPIDSPALGANPWGARVERAGDRWVFVAAIPTADIEARKSC